MPSVEKGRADAEEFLFREAYLIDEGRYEEWLELFHDDGVYWVPANHADSDPRQSASIIYDGAEERRIRVKRLMSEFNWSQEPRSAVRHLVSNVWIGDAVEPDVVTLHSNQLICQTRLEENHLFPAACVHQLEEVAGVWRIRLKKVSLLYLNQYLPPLALL